jgi:2'-5' RNA ligase
MLSPLPHVTLVKFENFHYSNLKNLLPPEGIDISDETDSFLVKFINLMESHLSREGAKYEKLTSFKLGRHERGS